MQDFHGFSMDGSHPGERPCWMGQGNPGIISLRCHPTPFFEFFCHFSAALSLLQLHLSSSGFSAKPVAWDSYDWADRTRKTSENYVCQSCNMLQSADTKDHPESWVYRIPSVPAYPIQLLHVVKTVHEEDPSQAAVGVDRETHGLHIITWLKEFASLNKRSRKGHYQSIP